MVIQDYFCMNRDKIDWESVGWAGGEAEGRCRRSKITDLHGKVSEGIVIQCLSEQKN